MATTQNTSIIDLTDVQLQSRARQTRQWFHEMMCGSGAVSADYVQTLRAEMESAAKEAARRGLTI